MPERLALEHFYEAAFDEQAYSHLLTTIAERIGARSFAAGWRFADGTAAMFANSGYWSPEQIALYDAEFAANDIWSQAQLANWKTDQLTNLVDLVSDREFERSEVWNEFFRPIGDDTWRCLCVGTETDSGVGGVAFHRGKARHGFDEKAEYFLAEHAQSIARVHALHGRIFALQRKASAVSHPLDAIAHAVFVVSAVARIIHMNAAAQELIELRSGLHDLNGKLQARDRVSNGHLRAAIGQAAKSARQQSTALAVRLDEGVQINLSIVPGPRIRDQAQVIVIAESKPASDPTIERRLRMLYGLSAGEARLASMLADGLDAAQIAEARRVAIGTVRQQIKSVTAKMGCRRQAEVVALTMRLPPLTK